jgi:hypothetical protein
MADGRAENWRVRRGVRARAGHFGGGWRFGFGLDSGGIREVDIKEKGKRGDGASRAGGLFVSYEVGDDIEEVDEPGKGPVAKLP